MSNFSEIWNGPSFLERGAAAQRMRMRDEAGKHAKKHKKTFEHFSKEWDKDLWD